MVYPRDNDFIESSVVKTRLRMATKANAEFYYWKVRILIALDQHD